MYRENIENLIKTALLNKKTTDLKVLRLIKSEFQTFSTAKDNKGNLNILDDVAEIKILKKLHKQWIEERDAFKKVGRLEDATALGNDLLVLDALIPAELSQEETKSKIKNIIENYLKSLPIEERTAMKHLGAIIKLAKADNPMTDGKLVSEIYKSIINNNV